MKPRFSLAIAGAALSLSAAGQGTHPNVADAGNSALVARKCVVYRAQFWSSTPALPQDIADAALSECGPQRAAAMSDAQAALGDAQALNRIADDEFRRAAVAAVLQTRYSKK